MPKIRKPAAAIAVAAALLASLFVSSTPATAETLQVNRACTTVEGIFARGSGQDLGAEEAAKFDAQLTQRVNVGSTTYDTYELGTDTYEERYTPVAVGGESAGSAWNSFSGWVTSGGSWQYGDSVNRGVAELDNYVEQRRDICPDTVFVLGGYSQGAQVIGETYTEKLTADEKKSVAFNILLGDPKLNLPEGRGINPPACRGEEFSEWRRGFTPCDVDNGSLAARDPYLETGWADTSGLWCNDVDFVCGSRKAFWGDSNLGHMTYAVNGGAIDEAAIEAALRLKLMLPPNLAKNIDDSVLTIGTGTTGTDVVFTIDSTGSMGGYINEAREYARTMANAITLIRGRVALVEYRDAGDEFVAEIRSPLSSDLTKFTAALDNITVDGGGDTPEAGLAALMTGFNGLDWKPGATKAAVILTDAGFHDPDVATGDTVATVAKRSLEIDPVNVYPVVPSYLVPEYEPLAEATSGQVIPNTGDTAAALTQALELIKTRPVPRLPLLGYTGLTGESFTFDASASYVADSTITEFAFDFNGDGVFEQVGLDPVAKHTYAAPFAGVMQVRVTAADGGLASASATVNVTDEPVPSTAPAAPDNLTATVVSTVDGVSEVELTWTPADTRSTYWAFSVNGYQVGGNPAAAESTVRITDVKRSEPVTFAVTGVTGSGDAGEDATVVLDALAAAPTPDPGGTPGDGPVITNPGGNPAADGTVTPVKPEPAAVKMNRSGNLSDSGAGESGLMVAAAGALLFAGALTLVISRRRQRRVS